MDLEIGSNVYRNTDGIVECEGLAQLELTLRKPDGPLMVNFVVFDEVGRVTAKVVSSSMAFNERRALELSRTPTSLVITRGEGGKVILQVELVAPDRVAIRKGEFITAKGHVLEITSTEWRVGKQRMSGKETDVKGRSVEIG